MKRLVLFMAAASACMFSASIAAADTTATWSSFNAFSLKVPMELPPPLDTRKAYTSWKGRGSLLPTASQTSDLSLDAEMFDGQTAHAGSFMLIRYRVMVIKGPLFTDERDGKPDFEGAVSVGMMAMGSERLVLQILTAALPQGPDALKGEQAIDYTETKTALPTAPAPWKVKGIAKRNTDGSVDYDLTLTTYAPSHPDVARNRQFVGSFSRVTDADIPDDTSLQGWTLSNMGTKLHIPSAGTVSQPAAVYKTVGEVRAAVEAKQ